MSKTKVLTTATAILLFIGTATAVIPGQGPELKKNYNDTVINVTTDEPQLFNTTIQGSNISVDVKDLEAKGDYSFDVVLNNSSGNSSTYRENFTLTVDSYNNYTLNPMNISKNISIGSSGELQQVSINGQGNTVEKVGLALQGNISSFVTLLDDDKFIPVNGTRPVNLVYDVPRSKAFGSYNGSLIVNSSDRSRNVSIDIGLVDEIRPGFQSNNVSDFMATNPQTFMIEASDNLKVSNASVEIVREYSEVVNQTTNETRVVNETISNGTMTRMQGDDQRWTYRFTDVDEIDEYYAVFNISDESNNSNNLTASFNINGLDSISILDGDFEFEDSRPRTDDDPTRQVVKEVFSKTSERELDLYLSDVDTGNNSVFIGVKNEEMSNPKPLFEDNRSRNVTVTDSGNYSLVVYSDSEGFSYSGNLNFNPVTQHVDFDRTVVFSGAFVDPEYPELPGERSLGSFTGSMEFVLNENGVPEGLIYEGEQMDISDCKGADSWSNCLTGYTLGEIDQVKQENQNLRGENQLLKMVLPLPFLFVGFIIMNNYATGIAVKTREVPKEKVSKIVKKDETLKEALE